ncbi:glycosyltransferase [Paenalcaligenes faecalis]|uniref:glycosyltransferase n=1 Tax=Paenalcaligenes faecalis TaxID=2980099 RepID=UPI0022B9556A|nr:glycosyltransferase [Paenalcaligenes faecalis]
MLLGSSPSQHAISAKDTLIFIRYINKTWLNYLKKLNEKQRPHLVFFIDDDVFDYRMHVGLPWRYRYKLYCFAASYQKQLKKMGFALWVSTPWLQQKYQQWQPVLRPPKNPYNHQKRGKDIVFYHGTASHEAEIEWLAPIFESVLKENKKLNIELIGNRKVQQLFKDMAGVHVYHHMSWYSYRELISSPGRIIGLAPLLQTPFNQARSASKFFDITYAGAVGIYAKSQVYANQITHGENGLLLPMDSKEWVEQILYLAESSSLRAAMWQNAYDSITF